MGVAGHLRIEIEEYDTRIRNFVPGYEEMVTVAAGALRLVRTAPPVIIDLGVGTGALAAACLRKCPAASLLGIDSDAGMLEVARSRLSRFANVDLVHADFLDLALPECDALVASIALHHIRTPVAKRRFYARCRQVIRPGGIFVSADSFPGKEARVAAEHRDAWLAHLQKTCSRADAEGHLTSWASEDVYFPLEDELAWLREAGFAPEVLWRKDGFAVVAGFPTTK